MKLQWAENSVKCLCWIGLVAIDDGHTDTAFFVADNMMSVAKSAAAKIKNIATRELADLLVPMRMMVYLAGEIGYDYVVKQLEVSEAKLISELPAHGDLKLILHKYASERINEIVRGRYPLYDPADPQTVMLQILRRRMQKSDQSGETTASGE